MASRPSKCDLVDCTTMGMIESKRATVLDGILDSRVVDVPDNDGAIGAPSSQVGGCTSIAPAEVRYTIGWPKFSIGLDGEPIVKRSA